MKIEQKDRDVLFMNLKTGDCFTDNGTDIYMVIEKVQAINGIGYNAVNLKDGKLWHFAIESNVEVLKAKVVIE